MQKSRAKTNLRGSLAGSAPCPCRLFGGLSLLAVLTLPVLFLLAMPISEAIAQAKTHPPAQARTSIETPARAKITRFGRSEKKSSEPKPRQRLREELNKILASRHLLRGTTAVLAVDAQTGEVLFAANESKKLNPASNVKLFSMATVLDILGDDYRYKTRLVGLRPDSDGVIHGGVYLLGSGDPSFLQDEVDSLVANAVASGIQKIDGDIHLSDDAYRDTLGLPQVRVVISGARRPGHRPAISYSPRTDFIEIINRAQTSRRRGRARRLSVRGKIVADKSTGKKTWVITVSGRIGRRTHKKVRLAAPLPSTFSGHVVRSALIASGIDVSGDVRIEDFGPFVARGQAAGKLPVELVAHESLPISELVSIVNKRSVNHLADRLVMTAAAHEGNGQLSMKRAIDSMYSFFRRVGIDPDQLVIDTGSGLSYKTKLTAEQIVRMLRIGAGFAPGSRGNGESFLHSLSIGGVDGTLRGRLQRVHGDIIGKTGTLTSCHALSGFVVPKQGGHPIAFSIVTNGNRRRDRKAVRSEHEALAETIHHYATTMQPRLQPR